MEVKNKAKLIAIFTLRINRTAHGNRTTLINDRIWKKTGNSNVNTQWLNTQHTLIVIRSSYQSQLERVWLHFKVEQHCL